MKHLIYTVYDKGVQAFLPPFYVRAQGEALRSFTEAANDGQRFRKYAEDYVLMKLGEFDDTSGLFVCGEPVRVISAVEVLSEEGLSPPPRPQVGNGRLPM